MKTLSVATLWLSYKHSNDLITATKLRENRAVGYQQLLSGDGAVRVHDENLGTKMIGFTKLGSYKHAGAGHQL